MLWIDILMPVCFQLNASIGEALEGAHCALIPTAPSGNDSMHWNCPSRVRSPSIAARGTLVVTDLCFQWGPWSWASTQAAGGERSLPGCHSGSIQQKWDGQSALRGLPGMGTGEGWGQGLCLGLLSEVSLLCSLLPTGHGSNVEPGAKGLGLASETGSGRGLGQDSSAAVAPQSCSHTWDQCGAGYARRAVLPP